MSNSTKSGLRVALIVVLTLLQVKFYGATHFSAESGNWCSEDTWVGGVIPQGGDSVVIMATHTVTISNQQDYSMDSPLRISLFGTLKFTNGNKLRLPCNSYIYVYPGAQIVPGTGGGSSDYIEICNIIVWSASDGTYTTPGCLGCSMLLPVELTQFNVENKSHEIAINWAVSSEKDMNYFLVERSVDGSNWEAVLSVKAAKNASQSLNYEEKDENPLNGISYYRLKLVEENSNFNYSEIRSVERNKKEADVSVFPNPSNGIVTIAYQSSSMNYEVFDVTGKKIEPHINRNLQNEISLDFSNLERGIYLINIHTPENNQYVFNKVLIH